MADEILTPGGTSNSSIDLSRWESGRAFPDQPKVIRALKELDLPSV